MVQDRKKNKGNKESCVHKRRQRLHKALFSILPKRKHCAVLILGIQLSKVHCNRKFRVVYLAERAARDESLMEAYGKDAKVTDLAGRHILLDCSCVALASYTRLAAVVV